MQNALADNDNKALAHVAHAVKGMTSVFYTDSVTALAAELEQRALQNEPDLSALTQQLIDAINQLMAVFQNLLDD